MVDLRAMRILQKKEKTMRYCPTKGNLSSPYHQHMGPLQYFKEVRVMIVIFGQECVCVNVSVHNQYFLTFLDSSGFDDSIASQGLPQTSTPKHIG